MENRFVESHQNVLNIIANHTFQRLAIVSYHNGHLPCQHTEIDVIKCKKVRECWNWNASSDNDNHLVFFFSFSFLFCFYDVELNNEPLEYIGRKNAPQTSEEEEEEKGNNG